MPNKILLVDDSALMRSVIGDIINKDPRFHVEDKAKDGLEALEMLRSKKYDAVVLDVNMPRMNGLELLQKLRAEHIPVRVMVASTDTVDGSETAMKALEYGATDFVHKPERASEIRGNTFGDEFINTLAAVCAAVEISDPKVSRLDSMSAVRKMAQGLGVKPTKGTGNKIVAIASSTGGPKSLQSVIPELPADLNAPVVLVQHMPMGFTASLATRLDAMSKIKVQEAKEGDELEKGHVYIAKGGMHMVILNKGDRHMIHFKDLPPRENVKPCANYMYESLADSHYDEVVCAVLTGMGADGTEGISNLKRRKRVYVISQNADTCIVYGMPKAVAGAGLSNKVLPLNEVAEEITTKIGVL